MVRLARPAELATLREIERSAGRMFADVGMAAVAADEPLSLAVLSDYCADERLWVAIDDADVAVAYLALELVDRCAHIEQVSVHADHAGRGLGRTLVQRVLGWAEERGLPAVTLTTFRDVPWNRPYYERLGFRVLPHAEWSPGLVRIREEEGRLGLDAWPRVCMRLDL
ncbi:MAG: GNAT family N-acetyltransferase [Pseudomonadota bacterium]